MISKSRNTSQFMFWFVFAVLAVEGAQILHQQYMFVNWTVVKVSDNVSYETDQLLVWKVFFDLAFQLKECHNCVSLHCNDTILEGLVDFNRSSSSQMYKAPHEILKIGQYEGFLETTSNGITFMLSLPLNTASECILSVKASKEFNTTLPFPALQPFRQHFTISINETVFPSITVEEDPECTSKLRSQQLSFLEEGTLMSNALLSPVIEAASDILTSQITQMSKADGESEIVMGLHQSIGGGIPGPVVKWTTEALSRNVTNLLTDSITFYLNDRLANVLSQELGPSLSSLIFDRSEPQLYEELSSRLESTIPPILTDTLPISLDRSLSIILMEKIMKTTTESIVPALSLALSHNSDDLGYCHSCFSQHLHCHLCQYSNQRLYYHNYMTTYYAEYYGTYYSAYFTEALIEMDKAVHAPQKLETNRKTR